MADTREGLELWGPVGRWLFLNWPRGSWQYDLICGVIIVGLFVLPAPRAGERQAASARVADVGVADAGVADARFAGAGATGARAGGAQAGAALDVGGVLAAMERAEAELHGFEAEMAETTHFALFDETDVLRGTLRYLEPGRVRRDFTEPVERVEVVADDEARVYHPRIKKVDVYPLESAAGQELVIPGLASARELEEAYEVTLEQVLEPEEVAAATEDGPAPALEVEARTYVLELVPRPGTVAARYWESIRLWLEEGGWHPARRIVLTEPNGDTKTLDLRDVERNPGLEPSDFELDLPDDVRVVRHGRPGTG